MSDATFWGALLGAVSAGLFGLLHFAFAVFIVARPRTPPAVRMAWLLIVILFPVGGALLYLRFGRVRRLGLKPNHRSVANEVARLAEAPARPPGDRVEIESVELAKGARLVEAVGGMPPSGGNELELFADDMPQQHIADAVRRLIDDIEAAQSSCHMMFYIYLEDGTGTLVAEALIRAARRGVSCRLLVDAVGSRPFLGSGLRRKLEQGGVAVVAALAVNPLVALVSRFDYRNHRKLVVIDGEVGWTGSQNLADSSFAVKARYAPWVDIMVRIRGPAVHDLQRVFVQDWLGERPGDPQDLLTERPATRNRGVAVQILPTGPSLEAEAMKQVSLLGFLETDRELILTTPYFVPDEATASALSAIARAGVRTVLVVPRVNDSRLVGAASRSYYEELLVAGAEIYEYRGGLLHAKTFTFDGAISVVATANLDRRSYELNYELSMVVADLEFTAKLREVQMAYVARSQRVDADAWVNRPLARRLLQNAAGLLSPLL